MPNDLSLRMYCSVLLSWYVLNSHPLPSLIIHGVRLICDFLLLSMIGYSCLLICASSYMSCSLSTIGYRRLFCLWLIDACVCVCDVYGWSLLFAMFLGFIVLLSVFFRDTTADGTWPPRTLRTLLIPFRPRRGIFGMNLPRSGRLRTSSGQYCAFWCPRKAKKLAETCPLLTIPLDGHSPRPICREVRPPHQSRPPRHTQYILTP